jgi:hypothetical protein
VDDAVGPAALRGPEQVTKEGHGWRPEERNAEMGAQECQREQYEVLAHERQQDEEERGQRRAQHQPGLAPAEPGVRAVRTAAHPRLGEQVDDVVPGHDEADDRGGNAQVFEHGRDEAVQERRDDVDAEEAGPEDEGLTPGEGLIGQVRCSFAAHGRMMHGGYRGAEVRDGTTQSRTTTTPACARIVRPWIGKPLLDLLRERVHHRGEDEQEVGDNETSEH